MATPDKLGRWRIDSTIGQGGQGRVYRARGGESEPEVAIKVVKLPTEKSKRRVRFVREVKALVLLSQEQAPNILRIIDENLSSIESGDTVGYIVMPLAYTSLAKSAVTFHGRTEFTLETFRGIVNGVMAAHSRGIIHRDIKPENILFLDKELREPMVGDFGCCFLKARTSEDRITDVNETVGSKFFMSPEQYMGGPFDVTPAADVYGLGKLLVYMLTGRMMRREEIDQAFSATEIAADPRLTRVRDMLLSQTIAYEPTDRFADAGVLLKAVDDLLREFRGGGTSPVPPAPTPQGASGDHSMQTGHDAGRPLGDVFAETRAHIRAAAASHVSMDLDDLGLEYQSRWRESLRGALETQPRWPKEQLAALILAETEIVGRALAIANYNAVEQLPALHKLIERVTDASRGDAGYIATAGIPHLLAGFIYMATAVQALRAESWDIWSWALTATFKWYYRSGKPLFSHGFNHSYFFHSEAVGREASATHDLFRSILESRQFTNVAPLSAQDSNDLYVQTQFLMTIKAVQRHDSDGDAGIWPDFGRFYAQRLTELLYRIDLEPAFSSGVLRPFSESSVEWLEKLDARLRFVRANCWGGSPFHWFSLRGFSEGEVEQ